MTLQLRSLRGGRRLSTGATKILTVLFVAALSALVISFLVWRVGSVGSKKYERATAPNSETKQREVSGGSAAAPAIVHKTVRLELDVKRFVLKERRELDLVEGPPSPVAPENCASGEREYAYKNDTYVCVKRGIVTFLGYNIQGTVAGPLEALTAVGLEQSADPIRAGPIAYVWMYEGGNPLAIGDRLIPTVRLIMGERKVVEIDMHGWERIQGKRIPDRHQAMLEKFVDLLRGDFPGLVVGATLESGIVAITVTDSWVHASRDGRLFFVEAAHERWSAEGAIFGEKTSEDTVMVKHYLSGRELATWSSFRGAHLSEGN